MSTAPQLSVVIPAYNEARYLERCLASLNTQHCSVPFEVIVVVTSMQDNSIPVVEQYINRVQYPLRYFIEEQRGVCAARQAGCQQARGEIIVSTDADIEYNPGWLERIVQAFQGREVVAVAGPFLFQRKPLWAHLTFKGLFKLTDWFSRIFGSPLYVAAMNFAFTKQALNQIGGYNITLHQGGDEYDLLRRFRKIGKVSYLHHNGVRASNRRFQRNIVYSFFVTFLYYYLAEYWFARLFKRSLSGPAPAIREERYR